MEYEIFKTPNFLFEFNDKNTPLNGSINIITNTFQDMDDVWKNLSERVDSFDTRINNIYAKLDKKSYLSCGKIDHPLFIQSGTSIEVHFLNLKSRFDEDITYIIKSSNGEFKKIQTSMFVDATNVEPGNILSYKISAQTETESSKPIQMDFLVIDEIILDVEMNFEYVDGVYRIRYIPNKTNITQKLNSSDTENIISISEKFDIQNNEYGWDIIKNSENDYKIYVCIKDKFNDIREYYFNI